MIPPPTGVIIGVDAAVEPDASEHTLSRHPVGDRVSHTRPSSKFSVVGSTPRPARLVIASASGTLQLSVSSSMRFSTFTPSLLGQTFSLSKALLLPPLDTLAPALEPRLRPIAWCAA